MRKKKPKAKQGKTKKMHVHLILEWCMNVSMNKIYNIYLAYMTNNM